MTMQFPKQMGIRVLRAALVPKRHETFRSQWIALFCLSVSKVTIPSEESRCMALVH